uniref:Uncharacterized protein n=1 Tax=Anguilla anguilla TaxID=7936 RepID=A0A0E9TRK2_ANGAN
MLATFRLNYESFFYGVSEQPSLRVQILL